MREDKEYTKMEKNIINCFDHNNYTPAEVYMVCEVVKFVYMQRAAKAYAVSKHE